MKGDASVSSERLTRFLGRMSGRRTLLGRQLGTVSGRAMLQIVRNNLSKALDGLGSARRFGPLGSSRPHLCMLPSARRKRGYIRPTSIPKVRSRSRRRFRVCKRFWYQLGVTFPGILLGARLGVRWDVFGGLQ